MNIDKANSLAVDRMMEARPVLVGVSTARDVIPDMGDRLLLHAGPPIEWGRMSGPMQGAVIGAVLFEGWADDEQAAIELAAGGELSFDPCHHHRAVGPMAGVISPSMAVYVVENATHGNLAYSNMNEGYGKVCATAPTVPMSSTDCAGSTTRWPTFSAGRWRRRTASICAPCWPKPCTWATKDTTATRPARS